MKRMKRWLLRGLRPGAGPVTLTVIAALVLLPPALLWEEMPDALRYAVYALSFYALVTGGCALALGVLRGRRWLFAHSALAVRVTGDEAYRSRMTLRLGLGINLLYAAFKLCAGYVYRSAWLFGLGVYYAVLAALRAALLLAMRRAVSPCGERRCVRAVGLLLLLLDAALGGLVIQMVWRGRAYAYPGVMIYAFAAYAFYKLIAALVAVARGRRIGRLLAAARKLTLCEGMVAILALQTALMSRFGGEADSRFAPAMNAATGAAVCLFVAAFALSMIRDANRGAKG